MAKLETANPKAVVDGLLAEGRPIHGEEELAIAAVKDPGCVAGSCRNSAGCRDSSCKCARLSIELRNASRQRSHLPHSFLMFLIR